MSTLTVELSDDLAARLDAASQHRRVTPADLVRETLAASLAPASVGEPPAADPLWQSFIGCAASGLGDLSTNPEHLEGLGR
jgi:hypothetical protein